MTDEQIFKKKRAGDYDEVAKILGLTRDNVRMTLKRPNAKKYNRVMGVLRRIVELRETMQEQLRAETEIFQQ
ncbi:hypothetical protein [Saccharicrinis fermentans]|nr:hypothetical protein [Saccharicrinis fermentans]